MPAGGIYLIRLSDTHYYGGRASDFRVRWGNHLSALKAGRHPNPFMQNVFSKHRLFNASVLLEIQDESGRLRAEQEWLDANFGRAGCLNVSPSSERGSSKGVKRATPETGKRISASLKGRPCSPETREKLGSVSRKRWDTTTDSEETRGKKSLAARGRKHTETSKVKMSEIALGRGGLGPRHHSVETRQKMSDSQKARFDSAARHKSSEAQRARRARERVAREQEATCTSI